MANKPKRSGRSKGPAQGQTYIPGTEPPEPPEIVAKLRDDYLSKSKALNKLKTTVGAISDQLIVAMREAGIDRVWNHAEGNWLVLDEKFKLKREKAEKED